ncbi:MAG TPA: peptidoglycan-associated lipoprotein Pal [Methyloceanibacter sp.]|jgi:peptidoglycan-associated lipoprotein|nr:peptidoglycan-associated lipoprotein Pal [Methyloceanibacter sp.]
MRWSCGVARACKIAGVVALAIVLAACSRQAQPRQYGLGGEGPATPGTERDFAVNVGDVVRFEVDSSTLTGEAQGILQNQARWLNDYPQYGITIEGHADERGTREYNLALGAKRAIAVRSFLASQGVRAPRIKTISYGKERPVAVCDDISCWSQNRRAQTVLNSGAVAGNY